MCSRVDCLLTFSQGKMTIAQLDPTYEMEWSTPFRKLEWGCTISKITYHAPTQLVAAVVAVPYTDQKMFWRMALQKVPIPCPISFLWLFASRSIKIALVVRSPSSVLSSVTSSSSLVVLVHDADFELRMLKKKNQLKKMKFLQFQVSLPLQFCCTNHYHLVPDRLPPLHDEHYEIRLLSPESWKVFDKFQFKEQEVNPSPL